MAPAKPPFSWDTIESRKIICRVRLRHDPQNDRARQLLDIDTQVLQSDFLARHISDRERCNACVPRFSCAGERLDSCAKSKGIDLNPTSPAEGLPALKSQWLDMKPKLQSLRRSGDGGMLDVVMDLVSEIERQTQAACGNPEGLDHALLLLSQDKAGGER